VSGALLVALLAAAPAPGVDAASVLKSLEAAGRALRTMKADFAETRVTLLLDEKEESRGSVLLQVPGSLRWDYRAPEPKALLIKDGKFARYFPKSKQVLRGIAKGDADLLVGFGPGAAQLGSKYQVSYQGEERVGGSLSRVLDLKPRGDSGLFAAIRLWVDAARSIPVQTRLTEPTGDFTTILFQNVEINATLPGNAFELSLPNDVVEVK
jgi:outer membrane lipoprotein-sorting protein